MKTTKNTTAGAGTITITVGEAKTLCTYLCMAFDQRINNEIMALVNDDKNWVLVSENGKEIRVLSASTLVEMLNIVHKYEELKAFYKEKLNVSPDPYIQYLKDTKNFSDLMDQLSKIKMDR